MYESFLFYFECLPKGFYLNKNPRQPIRWLLLLLIEYIHICIQIKHSLAPLVCKFSQSLSIILVYFVLFRCWSSVGKKYWRYDYGQEVSLGKGCNHRGTIMHEIMHAIGFWHEHSRPDRNLYVEVLWENILDGTPI